MKRSRLLCAALLPLMLSAASVAAAQGKGHDKGHGGGAAKASHKADKHADNRPDKGSDEPAGRRADKKAHKQLDKAAFENAGKENKKDEKRVVAVSSGAVAARPFTKTVKGGRRQIVNRNGAVLVDVDDDRELGNWKVVTERYREKKGSPSFCRSGAGHPVWGRQWCVEKGFGLGRDNDLRWSRVLDPSRVIITRPTTSDLTRNVLLDVLGSVVLNRLATHAVTLGYQDPLSGRWLGGSNDAGPRVLLVSSGSRPVAELVDTNRDGTADLMLVPVRR